MRRRSEVLPTPRSPRKIRLILSSKGLCIAVRAVADWQTNESKTYLDMVNTTRPLSTVARCLSAWIFLELRASDTKKEYQLSVGWCVIQGLFLDTILYFPPLCASGVYPDYWPLRQQYPAGWWDIWKRISESWHQDIYQTWWSVFLTKSVSVFEYELQGELIYQEESLHRLDIPFISFTPFLCG